MKVAFDSIEYVFSCQMLIEDASITLIRVPDDTTSRDPPLQLIM